jgi:Phage integrase family
MHQRIRERLPRLGELVEAAESWRAEQTGLLAAAAATADGEAFEYQGRAYERRLPQTYKTGPYTRRLGVPDVVVVGLATGEQINVSTAEENAFWAWAVIEILRHSGIRLEELLELTHMALVSYRLPGTGEIVPLLQIVPSKTNQERLLLVPPELASVLAAIITRLRGDDGQIPLVTRYDPYERVTGPPLPHLLQRRWGWRRETLTGAYIYRVLASVIQRAGICNAAGQPVKYTPHDFRRVFATDAVTGGLPVHIAAKILGHEHLGTEHYLAVFQDDLIRSYQAFLSRRRAARPAEEYREPTDQEWADFQEHFLLRRVELTRLNS